MQIFVTKGIGLLAKVRAKDASVLLPGASPWISITRWATKSSGFVTCETQRGFHLVNLGASFAFDVNVKPFSIIGTATKALPIPELGPGQEGFVPIWLENAGRPNWQLDVALGIEARSKIKKNRMIRGATLTTPISVIYRDSNHRWYQSNCSMVFSLDGISFTATTQIALGTMQPQG